MQGGKVRIHPQLPESAGGMIRAFSIRWKARSCQVVHTFDKIEGQNEAPVATNEPRLLPILLT